MKILITGAASGIGRAATLTLATHGHTVIAGAHTDASRDAFIAELTAQGLSDRVTCITLDITNEEHRAQIDNHEIDAVIANAAIGESGPLSDIPVDRLRHVIETNVIGTIAVCQRVAQQLIHRNSTGGSNSKRGANNGRIVIVGSTAGLVTLPFLGPYNLTKFALESAADALRMELKQFGISVSLIEPGKIDTGFNQKMTASKYNWLNETSPYARGRADFISELQKSDAAFFSNEYSVSVVTKGIMHAVTAQRPRPRYITPRRITLSIYLARLTPSRLRDRILRSMIRI